MSEYIDRERARFECKRFFKGDEKAQEDCEALLCELPAADVAPVRRGKWGCYNPFCGGYPCSSCKLTHRNCTAYCPNCGAKMKLVDA